MRHRTAVVVAGAALVAALAFAAGFAWSRRAPVPATSSGAPLVAVDAGAIDLGPGRPLTVDWEALAPPSAPLPAPGSAGAVPVKAPRAPAP